MTDTAIASAPVKSVTVKPVNFTNNKEARDALAKFKKAKADKKAAEKAQKEAEKVLRDALGQAQEAIILGQTALRVSSLRTRVNIDAKLLLEAFPEAYDATASTSTWDYLIES